VIQYVVNFHARREFQFEMQKYMTFMIDIVYIKYIMNNYSGQPFWEWLQVIIACKKKTMWNCTIQNKIAVEKMNLYSNITLYLYQLKVNDFIDGRAEHCINSKLCGVTHWVTTPRQTFPRFQTFHYRGCVYLPVV